MSKFDKDPNIRINPMGDEEEVPARGPEADEDDETLSELNEHIINIINSEGVDMGSVGNASARGISAEQLPNTIARGRPNRRLDVPILTRGTEQEYETNLTGSDMETVRSKGPEELRAVSNLKGGMKVEPRKNNYSNDDEAERSGLDHGASVDESFTGTGAIAIAPVAYEVYSDSDDDDDDDNDNDSQTENTMSQDQSIQEDGLSTGAPSGDPGMDHLGGQGVANRSSKQDSVGKYSTSLKGHGSYPRKHVETPAMCDVDEDGVEGKPQGVHQSSVGKPDDGHQTAVGHDWPDAPKNSGGVEAFGNSVSGGGQMSAETKWSPEFVGSLMEGDPVNLQSLFDAYARKHQLVCVEDFRTLCQANGSNAVLDDRSLENLMSENKEFIFYQGEDAGGLYWVPTPFTRPLNEGDDDKCCKVCKCEECECVQTEAQIRTPEEEGEWGEEEASFRGGPLGAGDPHAQFPGEGPGTRFDGRRTRNASDENYDDLLNMGIAADEGPGPFSDYGSDTSCPECTEVCAADDQYCSHCGTRIGSGPEEHVFGEVPPADVDDDIDWDTRGYQGGEDLDESVYRATTRILNENDAVEGPEGKSVAGNASDKWLNKAHTPTDMQEHGGVDKNLKGEPTNKSGVTPVIANTHQMEGISKQVQANISRLAVHTKRSILEAAKKLRGKYDLSFTVMLREGTVSSRSPKRKRLSEALADAEEALQFFDTKNVSLETSFCDASGCAILHNIPMIQIEQRGPMVSEGRVVFRFQNSAERFADKLVAEGKTCKITNHSWGKAVVTSASYAIAEKCFMSAKR